MKTNVWVIFGSRSTEHDVSIVTAFGVMKVLSDMPNIEVYPIYITKTGQWIYSEKFTDIKQFPYKDNGTEVYIAGSENHKLTLTSKSSGIFSSSKSITLDCIFPLIHGLNGEDGTIQWLCEVYNIPYVGPNILTASRTIDKIMTKYLLQSIQVPVVPASNFTKDDTIADITKTVETKHKFPVFVKPYNAGSSIGVSRVTKVEYLAHAVEVAFYYSPSIIIENGVQPLIELNCAVSRFPEWVRTTLVEQPVAHSEYLSFEEKYISTDGGTMQWLEHKVKIPADVDQSIQDKIQQHAKDIYSKLQLTGAPRIDFLHNPETGELFVCEVNAVPGNMQMHLREKSGMTTVQFIQNLIDQAFLLHQKRQNTTEFANTILQHTISFAK